MTVLKNRPILFSMNDDMIKDMIKDIEGIDPQGVERAARQWQRRRIKRVVYNRRAYLKNQDKLRQRARDRYKPVIQATSDIEPIDYNEL